MKLPCRLSASILTGLVAILLAASACPTFGQEAPVPDSSIADDVPAPLPDSGATDSLAALPPPAQPAPLGPTDPAELEAFFDGLLEATMEGRRIAGATVAVVRGDSVFFAKGYGYADVNAERPVDPDQTLVRIGSVSKLFVWTAVMQLVEKGQLDLDADVNTYLAEFEIPATFEAPITLADLMTHTPGFEEHIIGLFTRDSTRLRPLGTILKEEMPARIWQPGELASYSNHGTGIAAYIVEQVSGQRFADYVEQHILRPLGMRHTTFRQPVPTPLAEHLAKGYAFADGTYQEKDFEYVPLAPVGAASASGTDMARFMLAHLHDGHFGDATILDTATAQQMHQPLFQPAPAINPMAHGFIDMSRNGHRVIGHGGDTFWFHSTLVLLPAYDVGFFIAFNSEAGGQATGDVYEAFMDRYFPPDDIPDLTPEAGPAALAPFTGSYRSVRYAHTSLAKLAAAFFTVEATATDDGYLVTDEPERMRWVQTGPVTFREEDGLETLAFLRNDDGEVTYLYFGTLPIIAFEKIGWWALPTVHLGLTVAALLLFLGVVVLMPGAAFLRKRHGYTPDQKTRVPIAARGMAWLTALGFLVFAVGFGLILTDPTQIAFGVPQSLRILLWFPLVAGVLTAGMLIYTVVIWIFGWGRATNRLGFTLFVLVCLAFLGQLYYWNLLGFNY